MVTGMSNQLSFLEESNFQFHLTGSRAFGSATKDSDWDFFAQYSDDCVEFLTNHMFETELWRNYKTPVMVLVRGDIHIQLVSSFSEKLKAQNYLLGNNQLLAIIQKRDKDTNKLLWDYALSKVAGGPNA